MSTETKKPSEHALKAAESIDSFVLDSVPSTRQEQMACLIQRHAIDPAVKPWREALQKACDFYDTWLEEFPRDSIDPALAEFKAVARYANNLDTYAAFHEKHPYANSIELWGAAMGRKDHEVSAAVKPWREALDNLYASVNVLADYWQNNPGKYGDILDDLNAAKALLDEAGLA
jgi:hypothetical protein